MGNCRQIEPISETQDPDAVIERAALQRLLSDVGLENAEAVMSAFVQELENQTGVLEEAARNGDPDTIAQTAHRLKSSAASFGATRLSRVAAAFEQAVRRGEGAAAMASTGELLELVRASRTAMEAHLKELLGSGGASTGADAEK
jgi:two-component system phosphorelay protein LuxU